MSQPPPFVISTDFSDEESTGVSGRSTVRTAALDALFTSAKSTFDAILTNLALIQRDDGALKDQVVTLFALNASVLAYITVNGGTIRGDWVTATDYDVKDVVVSGTGTYVCAVDHTSGVFAADLAAFKWIRIFDTTNYVASNVSFTPVGTIAAVTVQNAIAEAAAEALQIAQNLGDLNNVGTARTNLAVPSKAEIQNRTHSFVAAGGGADAITGAFTPAVTALTNGMELDVECAGANLTATPTFKADGTTAKTIVRPDGNPLLIGDIPGASFHAKFKYDASADVWILTNPSGVSAAGSTAGQILMSNGPTQKPTMQTFSPTVVAIGGYEFANLS